MADKDKKVWFVTGAGRGMGVDIPRVGLAAGDGVVATGRNPRRSPTLSARPRPAGRQARYHRAGRRPAAVERFGGIDVPVNNAGNFYAGFFEEVRPEHFRAQVETNLFGPLNVTRAVLPVMRSQRSGLVVTISSIAGIVGGEFNSPPTPRRSSPSRAGCSASSPKSPRWASAPCSSSPASSGPSCWRTPPRPGRSRSLTTTPSAPARPSPPGRR